MKTKWDRLITDKHNVGYIDTVVIGLMFAIPVDIH